MYLYDHANSICKGLPQEFPLQFQPGQPGIETLMIPRPVSDNPHHIGTGKLSGKVALITGGDSGIGRAIAYLFAKEGADIAIVYLQEHGDAMETQHRITQMGRKCLLLAGDIGDERFCRQCVAAALREFGHLEILINNAGELHIQPDIELISDRQLKRTFSTNFFSCFYFAKASVPYMKPGSTIINTSSVAAVQGYKGMLDYSATKGAINAFTRSLAVTLIEKGIRVNAVAPGRTWTPLIPAAFPPDQYVCYGRSTPLKRAAQPAEIAPAYLYLASDDSSYMVGQTLHMNGGEFYGL